MVPARRRMVISTRNSCGPPLTLHQPQPNCSAFALSMREWDRPRHRPRHWPTADWAPRKVAWDAEDIPWVTPTLEFFVQWAGELTGLERRWIEETVGAVHEFGGDFVVARLDGSQRSPATVIMESMLADGIDPTDAAAVQRWIDRYNASLD